MKVLLLSRVHYPLPLLEEELDVAQLKGIIRKLRAEMDEQREARKRQDANTYFKGDSDHAAQVRELERELKLCLKERDALAHRLDVKVRQSWHLMYQPTKTSAKQVPRTLCSNLGAGRLRQYTIHASFVTP